jgi:deazaflavin-dependent oxidoreductase (nitroreductase family)
VARAAGKYLVPCHSCVTGEVPDVRQRRQVDVTLCTDDAVRRDCELRGHDDGRATDRRRLLRTIGAQQLELVVCLANITMRQPCTIMHGGSPRYRICRAGTGRAISIIMARCVGDLVAVAAAAVLLDRWPAFADRPCSGPAPDDDRAADGEGADGPLFYLRDGDRLVVCNVNPVFDRPNPWIVNLRADPHAHVQVGGATTRVRARPASAPERDRYWPQLTKLWPAYQAFYESGGKRSVFVPEPAAAIQSAPDAAWLTPMSRDATGARK